LTRDLGYTLVISLALVQAGIFNLFLEQPTAPFEQRYDKIQTKQKSMASSTDPPFRPLAIRSMTESTPMSSSRARTIDELLGEFFAKDRVETFTDAELEQISQLLQNSGRNSYSRVPRIYSVLRTIDRLELLDEFIKINATDLSFPFSAASFPSTIQSEFLRSQSLVLPKPLDVEKGERGGHLHSGIGEQAPYEVKGRLGTGSPGDVEKVISLANNCKTPSPCILRSRLLSVYDAN
jgi:hypothetical protein